MEMNKNHLIIFLLSVTCHFIEGSTPIRRCTDLTHPLPLMVNIDDCTELPCDVWQDRDTHMEIQFLATKDLMRQLTANVHLTYLGMTIPYDLEPTRSNVCQNLMHGALCPLYAGEDVVYELNLPISPSQPDVPTKFEVTLLDDSDNSVVACFVTDTRVKRLN